ncbi:MAG TPA: FAD-binding oxidoreductase [Nocardioides sp.]|jgi:FAD/FMN-containing dehydrogenase|nr:FAD-binding oxidoreductase [Nocardioides sp.]
MTDTAVRLRPDVGRLVRRGDPDWDAARATFNVLDDQQPAAIAFPTDEDEVAAAVAFAREHGFRVAAQSTGHNATALGDLAGTIIVNTSALTGVEIDRARRRVRVGAATRWGAVTPQLSELGLAGLHGSSPDVGIVGYSLQGGIGWLARRHGMQANAVTAIELVTADGQLVRTDADHEPELFWALRGGGGNYGVVTAVEFDVQPVEQLYAGAMFFPVDRVAEVLHAWNDMIPGLPEEMTTWASVIHFPPFPEIPEIVRGQSFVIVLVAYLGDEATGAELLRPVRDLGPTMDTIAMSAPIALATQAMDPDSPLPFRSTTAMLDRLTPEAIEEVARVAGPGSALTLVEFRHVGGALHRAAPGAGARATLPGNIAFLSLGVVPDAALDPVVQDSLDALTKTLAPHKVGDYPNFVMRPTDAGDFFDTDTWERLRRVKSAYDPENLFRGNHQVPPA